MKLIFRLSARSDLKWFRRYYTSVFPEGEKHARRHYLLTCKTLLEHPQAGRSAGAGTPVRELPIPRTPFSFVYCVSEDEIIILRVLDARAERPTGFTL